MKIICRICKTQQGQFFTLDSTLQLTESAATISTIRVLREYFKLNVDLADTLPQTLCLECFNYLSNFYEFIMLARKSDEEFRQISSFNLYDDENEENEENVVSPQNLEDSAIENDYQEQLLDEDMWIIKTDCGTLQNERRKSIDYSLGTKLMNIKSGELKEYKEFDTYAEYPQVENSTSNDCTEVRQDVQRVTKYTCEFCYKTFNTRSSLKVHLNSHSHGKPYQCTICGKTFQQSLTLKNHMSLHIGKTIQCHVCQKRFSRPGHLNIHLRQHNNSPQSSTTSLPSSYKYVQWDKPYIEKFQTEEYVTINHSEIDSNSCTGVMHIQSTECSKLFNKKTLLMEHLKKGHELQPALIYCCNECNIEFTKVSGLHDHIKLKHSTDNQV